jgi:uncharacterized membrane protein YeaQ/YmgE (transglycosylase-associated protein family)
MNTHEAHHTPSPEDARDSAFLACTVLGTVAGAISSTVCSAQLLGGTYTEALSIAGAALGGLVFGALGATVIGPAWAALTHRRSAPVAEHIATH